MIILLCLKKLREILEPFSLMLVIETELLSTRIILVKVTLKYLLLVVSKTSTRTCRIKDLKRVFKKID